MLTRSPADTNPATAWGTGDVTVIAFLPAGMVRPLVEALRVPAAPNCDAAITSPTLMERSAWRSAICEIDVSASAGRAAAGSARPLRKGLSDVAFLPLGM